MTQEKPQDHQHEQPTDEPKEGEGGDDLGHTDEPVGDDLGDAEKVEDIADPDDDTAGEEDEGA
jgi:hypothetical protein